MDQVEFTRLFAKVVELLTNEQYRFSLVELARRAGSYDAETDRAVVGFLGELERLGLVVRATEPGLWFSNLGRA